jgi:hypothetical protein
MLRVKNKSQMDGMDGIMGGANAKNPYRVKD